MKKIDAHTHLGAFGGFFDVAIDQEELLATMDRYEVEKTLLCSTNSTDNDKLIPAFQANPDRFLPLAFLNPYDGDKALGSLDHYIDKEGFKGIKLHPLMHAYTADDASLDPIMEKARAKNLPVFIHSGHPPYSLPWQIGLLAERHPEVSVVMVHMGHGHGVYIDAAIKMGQKYPNILLETSGMPMHTKIREAYHVLGSDRVLFGMDLPFHHPTIEIGKVEVSGLNAEEQGKVFYHNAAKLMGLG